MYEFYKDNKNFVDKGLFFILFIMGFYFLFNNLFTYVAPFVFGYIVAIIINPLVNMFVKYFKVGRAISTIFAIMVLIFLIGVIGTAIVARLIQEGATFFQNLPQLIYYVESAINDFNIIFDRLYIIIPQGLQQTFYSLLDVLIEAITTSASSGIRILSTSIISVIPRVVIGVVLGLVSSYFFSTDKEVISQFLDNIIPKRLNQKIKVIKVGIVEALGGYFKAQLMLMGIIAVICIIGLTIIRAPYALFLGVIISIVDALPVFGSGFFYWPWIVFSIITGNYSQAIGLAIIYITVLLARQILEPKIVGNQIGIHPLITLMSIYIGLRLFGFIGIIIGPCIAVTFKTIINEPTCNSN